MEERNVARHLGGAELWARIDGEGGWTGVVASPRDRGARADGAAADGESGVTGRPKAGLPAVAFVSGWEDGEPFCAAICATDVGL